MENTKLVLLEEKKVYRNLRFETANVEITVAPTFIGNKQF